MACSLGYSVLGGKEGFNPKNKCLALARMKKDNLEANNKVKTMMEKIASDTSQDDDDAIFGQFAPPPFPESAGVQKTTRDETELCANGDNSVSCENSDETENKYQRLSSAYSSKNSAHNNPMASSFTNPELEEKLNYMIQLLEEQHDEKINSGTEEIVMYCFLGVFVIFMIDSFVRVGKYVR